MRARADGSAVRRSRRHRRGARVPRLRRSVARGRAVHRHRVRRPVQPRVRGRHLRQAHRQLVHRAVDGQHRYRLANGTETTGRQTNWRVEPQRSPFQCALSLDRSRATNFAVPLGILGRNYQPDTEGLHGFMEYRFWPEDAWIDRIGPRVFFANQDDQRDCASTANSRRSCRSLGPATASSPSAPTTSRAPAAEDFAGLTTRDYEQRALVRELLHGHVLEVRFRRELRRRHRHQSRAARGRRARARRPPAAPAELRWRPMDRLRVDTTYPVDVARRSHGRGTIFDDTIVRTRWNLQFTKEMSLRVIVQHEDTEPTALSSLAHDENLNLDVLFRYVLNPWSALYVGFNNNESNLQLVDTNRTARGARAHRGSRARRAAAVREVLVSIAA